MRVAASQYTNVHFPLVCCDRNCLGTEVVLLLTEFIKHTLMYYYVRYVLNLEQKVFVPDFLEKKLFSRKSGKKLFVPDLVHNVHNSTLVSA